MRALRSWLGLLGTLALAGLPAAAVAQPVGSEFQVNTYTTGNQGMYPYGAHLVAGDASGNFVVVWRGSGGGDVAGVFGQRYDSAGMRLGGEFRANSYTTGNQGSPYGAPSVAAAADGDFVVVWDGQGQGGFGVFGQRYDSLGGTLGGEFRVATGGEPSVAAAADGRFVVVWSGFDDGGFGIFGQRYDSEGIPQGDNFRVNSITTDEFQSHPSAAAAANGNFVVVWLSYSGEYDVLGQRYDNEGVALGDEFRLNTFVETAASVASDASGNFVVVWDGLNDAYESGIHGQRYDSAGVPQGDVFVVNSYEDAYQYRPSVASDASGNFVVAWDDSRRDGTDIFCRRFDSAGVAQGSDFRVNTDNISIHERPSVGATGTNQFVVVWESLGQDGGYGETGVFGRRVAAPPSLSISDVSANEGNLPGRTTGTLALFAVTLSRPSTQSVTVDFATANGTAIAPSDYTAKSGTLTFSPGQTSRGIAVVVNEDELPESDETFFVNLSNPMNATIADGQGVGTILNDDP